MHSGTDCLCQDFELAWSGAAPEEDGVDAEEQVGDSPTKQSSRGEGGPPRGSPRGGFNGGPPRGGGQQRKTNFLSS